MRLLLLLAYLGVTIPGLCQRTSKPRDPNYFIGKWELAKLADKHLTYLPDSVQKETLRFTKDSVFVSFKGIEFAGTWASGKQEPNIRITGTNQFNYWWISRDDNSIFLRTDSMNYYKYFKRVK